MKRVVNYNDTVEIFKDPDTEQDFEGYARVEEVVEENDEFYILQVTFFDDPRLLKVSGHGTRGCALTRKYRKYPPGEEVN